MAILALASNGSISIIDEPEGRLDDATSQGDVTRRAYRHRDQGNELLVREMDDFAPITHRVKYEDHDGEPP